MRVGIRQIEAFVLVADRQSFRAAAEGLNTTQPNISARIAGLEASLGYAVFERATGHVRLTPRGEVLLESARKILTARDGFLEVAGAAGMIQGGLRLGVTEMIAHSWLGSYLVALKEQLPNVTVDLIVDVSANLSPQLFNRSLDLALQSGPFDRDVSGSVDLGSYGLVWVAAPDMKLKTKTLRDQDIRQFPILTHARGTLPFEQLAEFLDQKGLKAQLIPSSNLAACLKMTTDGLGIACLPRVMVADDLKNRKLIALKYQWTPEPLKFAARFDRKISPPFVEKAAAIAMQTAQKYSDK